jgi:phospholipid/cholesterol/gamma-HCH transport system permease protein
MQIIHHLGRYTLLMMQVFRKPEKGSIYLKRILYEMDRLGLGSIGIVAFLSVFVGAVLTIQMAFNIDSPLVPLYTIGYATRKSIILEFSPTIMSLILAGKVGSQIAGEIGTMRVTEQIDALEIMGINPATYLIFPKIIAAMIFNPFLILMSMVLAIIGGWLSGISSGLITTYDYVYGLQAFYSFYDISYALIKTVFFAFIITSVSGYFGFYTKGGALEVGESSTRAVVVSSVSIIIFNLILTNLLLA